MALTTNLSDVLSVRKMKTEEPPTRWSLYWVVLQGKLLKMCPCTSETEDMTAVYIIVNTSRISFDHKLINIETEWGRVQIQCKDDNFDQWKQCIEGGRQEQPPPPPPPNDENESTQTETSTDSSESTKESDGTSWCLLKSSSNITTTSEYSILVKKDAESMQIYEPISELQSICEMFDNVRLIEKAIGMQEAEKRLALVATFVFSTFRDHGRTRIPVEGRPGESHEFYRKDVNLRVHSERIAEARGAATATEARGNGWTLSRTARPALEFTDEMAIVYSYNEHVCLELQATGETYWWSRPAIIHQPYIRHQGECVLRCSNGLRAQMIFGASEEWETCRMKGKVLDKHRRTILMLEAECSDKQRKFYLIDGTLRACTYLRRGTVDPSHKFQLFDSDLQENLPPTDSRLRPDIRLLTQNRLQEAADMMSSFETRTVNPLWFAAVWLDDDLLWKTNDQYWKMKEKNFNGVSFPKLW